MGEATAILTNIFDILLNILCLATNGYAEKYTLDLVPIVPFLDNLGKRLGT